MKIKNVAFVAALLASTSAFAADLPSRSTATAPAFAAPAAWSGLYVGLQAGAGQQTNTHWDLNWWYNNYQNYNQSDRSALVGVKVGYDMRFGNGVLGALVEGSYGQLKAGKELNPASPEYIIDSKITFLGSARGKLGFAFGAFNVFTTGGLAVSNAKHRYTETDGSGQVYDNSGTRFGYVLGLGADYAMSSKMSIGLDVSRYDFGKKTHELLDNVGAGTGNYFTQKDVVDTIMLSVNYKM